MISIYTGILQRTKQIYKMIVSHLEWQAIKAIRMESPANVDKVRFILVDLLQVGPTLTELIWFPV